MLYRRWMGKVERHELAEFTAEILATVLPGCSRLRGVLRPWPHGTDHDERLMDETLRAFVTTVIPDASPEDPNIVRAFSDPEYSFEDHRDLLVFDLAVRSARLGDGEPFDRLPRAARRRVIRDALASGDSVERLYRGAIFLAQASCYGGLYEEPLLSHDRLLARPA